MFFVKLARIIFGLTFIISGFFKISDPVGTELIVEEYLRVAQLGFFSPIALYIGLILSTLEFVTGLAILLGIPYNFFSYIALLMTTFFTGLTLVLAIFNPIQDCGCFGEVIHLTNWQTFFKNIALLLCIVLIFFTKKYQRRLAPNIYEWSMIGAFSVLILSYGIYAKLNIPILDFGNFKVGTDIDYKLYQSRENVKYVTKLVYIKDGVEKDFDMENLPDSSWTFVDSKTRLSEESLNIKPFDFSIRDINDELITTEILKEEKSVLILVYTDFTKITQRDILNINTLYNSVLGENYSFYVLTSTALDDILALPQASNLPIESFAFSDYKTLISLSRSNGGMIYIYDGIVVSKLARRNINDVNISKFFDKSPEDIIIRQNINQTLFYESVIASILVLLILMKIIFRAIYKTKKESK